MSGLELLFLDGGVTAGAVATGVAARLQHLRDGRELASGADLPRLRGSLSAAQESAYAGHQALTAAWRSPLSLHGAREAGDAKRRGVPVWALATAELAVNLVDRTAELCDLADVYQAQLVLAEREEPGKKKSVQFRPVLVLMTLLHDVECRLTGLVPRLVRARAAFDPACDVELAGEGPPEQTPAATSSACGSNSKALDEIESLHALIDAAERGDFDAVREHLQAHPAHVGEWPLGGESLLHHFARRGDAAAVRYLLERGADPGVQSADGACPADVAADPDVAGLLSPTVSFIIVRDAEGFAGFRYVVDTGTMSSVVSGSPAGQAGLGVEHEGWTITHVDGQEVAPESLERAIETTREPLRRFSVSLRKPRRRSGLSGQGLAPCSHGPSQPAKCEWMFADAAKGWLGFSEMAHWNPLRWSGGQSVERCICDLEFSLKSGDRPIYLRTPPGADSAIQRFDTTRKAIEHLRSRQEGRDDDAILELPLQILRGSGRLGSLYGSVASAGQAYGDALSRALSRRGEAAPQDHEGPAPTQGETTQSA